MNRNLPIIGMLLVLLVFAVSAAQITSLPTTISGATGENIEETFTFNTEGTEYSDVVFELSINNVVDTSAIFSSVSNPINGTEDVNLSFTMPSTAGTYVAKVTAKDGSSSLDSEEFTLEVLDQYDLEFSGIDTISTNPGESESDSIVITNTGEEDLFGLSVSYIATDFEDDGNNQMNVEFSETTFNLAKGESKTLIITVTPDNGQYIYPEREYDYSGTITVSNTAISKDFDLNVELEMVAFARVTIENLNDLDDLTPGEEFDVEMEIRDAKFDTLNVEIELTIYDFDEGDNFEETTEEYDIDDNDDEDLKLSLIVPLDINDQKFNALLKVNGDSDDDDYDDFTYYVYYEDAINVNKDERYDVGFSYITLEPETPRCGGTLTVNTKVINIGRDKLNDMYLKAKINELGISETSEDFDLKETDGDRDEKIEFLLDLPADMENREYTLEIIAYDEDNEIISGGVLRFTPIGDCIVTEEEDQDSNSVNDDNADDSSENSIDEDGTLFLPTGWTTSNLFGNESAKTVFWIIGDLALIVIIIYFLSLFFKKRK